MSTPKRRIQNTLIGSPPIYLAARRWFGVARFIARKPHDPDFRYFSRFSNSNGLFLDVGANSGSSALSYRIFDRSSQIVSLEPNPAHERDLSLVQRIIGPDFSYHLQGAAEEDGELTLFIPEHRGVPLTGEASIYRGEAADNWTAKQLGISISDIDITQVRVPVRPIDELKLNPHAVKVDVQGAELLVLKGMQDTLERAHPVLLIEASADTPRVTAQLSPLGYKAYWYDTTRDQLKPYDGRAITNVFFVVG